jgi:hypothetical protein
MAFDIGSTLKNAARKVIGRKPLHEASRLLAITKPGRQQLEENRRPLVSAGAAIAGAYFGGPAGAAAAYGAAEQTQEVAIDAPKRIEAAEEKQKTLQRKAVARLAREAYESRFMAGGRSLLTTRTTGKATVGG